MASTTDQVGKRYPPTLYAVGREKIREFAEATGETEPVCLDLDAARAAGYADLVAPPMFAVVYQKQAVWQAFSDPELGIDFSMLVHGGQDFRWGALVIAGDEITTRASVADISQRAGNSFFVFETESVNQRGEAVCKGIWSNVVRGA